MSQKCEKLLYPERVHYQESLCSAGTDVVTVLFVKICQQQCQNFSEAVETGWIVFDTAPTGMLSACVAVDTPRQGRQTDT